MVYTIFDIETDGLLDTLTKIHCLCYIRVENGKILDSGNITEPHKIVNFLKEQECLVGHNIIRFDIPAIEKVTGYKPHSNQILVDTLGLSWYLFPTEKDPITSKVKTRKHGLEHWGEILGIKKPEVEDWINLTLEEYINRCTEDVKINVKLFSVMMAYLSVIYEEDDDTIHSLMKYLTFKLDCLREQEEVKCKIDKESCLKYLSEINKQIALKTEQLAFFMPDVPVYKEKKKPSIYYKKDGNLSSKAIQWELFCEERGLDKEAESHKYISHYEGANPNSIDQKKEWLYSLGWEPTIFLERKNVKGEINEVAQISNEGKICSNIKALAEEYPFLENLEGLTILAHRKGVFEGFLKALDENDYVIASADGFTNTLRFQHRKPIANLTKVGKPWGKEIRSLIVTPDENHVLCGSDMSALEDTTKQHYMYFFDPEYVKQMRTPGFDPHIDIGVLAGLITEEESNFFKWYNKCKDSDKDYPFTEEENEKFKRISKERGKSKTVNFAGVYGAGPPKIAKTLKCDLEFAKNLHTTYWNRNNSVKRVAESAKTKGVLVPFYKQLRCPEEAQMWLYNPISKFWYSLRAEKDKFSTLNQGTGVYCFDVWLKQMRSLGVKIMLQYHDEIGFALPKGEEQRILDIKEEAINRVNKLLKLNVPLKASADFGVNYAEIH